MCFSVFTAKAFHDHEEMAFVLTNFMDGTDVGMVQRRRGAGFAAKPLQRLGIFRGFFRQKLQRDETAERRVFRFVDYSHATAAQQFHNAVVGNRLPDHLWIMA